MESDWQPIELAPKDYSIIVIVWPPTYEGTTSCARWNDDRYARKPRPYWHRIDANGTGESRSNPPTHFRPVLTGPKEERKPPP